MRFSISLLTVICIASVIGTVLKQQEPLGNYVNQFGPLWAAEAWGGYRSWDPKETWALICLLNYAAWLHMRLMKGLRGTRWPPGGRWWAWSSPPLPSWA
jgi:hypothetical protein